MSRKGSFSQLCFLSAPSHLPVLNAELTHLSHAVWRKELSVYSRLYLQTSEHANVCMIMQTNCCMTTPLVLYIRSPLLRVENATALPCFSLSSHRWCKTFPHSSIQFFQQNLLRGTKQDLSQWPMSITSCPTAYTCCMVFAMVVFSSWCGWDVLGALILRNKLLFQKALLVHLAMPSSSPGGDEEQHELP